MLVSDFYQTATEEYGLCDQARVFSAISKAIRLMEQKAHFDFSIQTLDISVCDSCITLPNFVGAVLAVNTCSGPSYLRDHWYQFHINSVGSESWTDCGYTDVFDNVPVIRDLKAPSRIVAVTESSADNSKAVRVFGFLAGKRIYTPGATGALEEGFLVPTISGYAVSNPNAPLIDRVERISKVLTNGFIRLVGINPDNDEKVLLGYYEPWEKTPIYKRIRISSGASWARIKYRKAYKEIRSMNDWINIENTLALQLAVRAVKLYEQDKFDQAGTAEAQAVRMLTEENEANRTPTPIGPQIVHDCAVENESIWDYR